MDTTGTFDVYNVLSQHKMLTCMNKHYSVSDYKHLVYKNLDPNYYMISTGISDNDFENYKKLSNTPIVIGFVLMLPMVIKPILLPFVNVLEKPSRQ